MNAEGTILVVDDVQASRAALAAILESEGYRALQAAGREAAIAAAAAETTDLALVSIGAEGPNGLDTCRGLTADPAMAEILVVVLSGTTARLDRAAAIGAGAADIMPSPVVSPESLAGVRAHVELSRTRRLVRRQTLELDAAHAPASASADRYRVALLGIGDGVISTDVDGCVDLMNSAAERMTGWSAGEARGLNLREVYRVVDEATRAPLENPAVRALRGSGGAETIGQGILIARDGAERPVATTCSVAHGDGGEATAAVLVIRDQSAERAARASLHRSDADLRRVQNVGNIGSWTWHIQENRVDWSDQMYRLFGVQRDAFAGDLAEVIAGSIHPDDRQKVEEANRSVVDHGAPLPCEYRIVLPDGRVRTVWAEAEGIEVDAAGKPVRLSGIVQDITDLKAAEAALAARAERQAALAAITRAALHTDRTADLFDMAVLTVASAMGVEMAKVLETRPGEDTLILRSGVGWRDGLVGSATVSAGIGSQAGYTLHTREPVLVPDLAQEARFAGPPLLLTHEVVSGMSVVIGSERAPYGVLGIHTRARRDFTEDEIEFVQTVANILGEAVSAADASLASAV